MCVFLQYYLVAVLWDRQASVPKQLCDSTVQHSQSSVNLISDWLLNAEAEDASMTAEALVTFVAISLTIWHVFVASNPAPVLSARLRLGVVLSMDH